MTSSRFRFAQRRYISLRSFTLRAQAKRKARRKKMMKIYFTILFLEISLAAFFRKMKNFFLELNFHQKESLWGFPVTMNFHVALKFEKKKKCNEIIESLN